MADESALSAVEEAAVQAQLAVDEDGDGVADVAVPLMLMVDADGDGISDGLHEDKLGLFVPQVGLINGRPVYETARTPTSCSGGVLADGTWARGMSWDATADGSR